MAFFDLRAFVRGGGVGGATPTPVNATPNGDLLVANGLLPRYAEAARSGNGYATMAVSAVAALVVRPTTAAALAIQNNTPGKVMVIDRLFTHELVTSTTGLGGGAAIWAAVTQPMALFTDAALAINSLSGRGAQTQSVRTEAAKAVADNGWFPYGAHIKKESAGAVVPGGSTEALIEGRLIVPYLCALALHVVSGYVADTFCSGASWYWADAANYAVA